MNEHGEQLHSVKAAITKLSQSQGKMTICDIEQETGITTLDEIINYLMRGGFIYYVNSTEFKKTPSRDG